LDKNRRGLKSKEEEKNIDPRITFTFLFLYAIKRWKAGADPVRETRQNVKVL